MAGTCLSTRPGLDRAETHERLLWLAGRFPFSLHEAVPESEGFPLLRLGSGYQVQYPGSESRVFRASELL